MVDIFSGINRVLSGIGAIQSVSVLKERIALLKDELDIIAKRYEKLEEENTGLVNRNNELEKLLSREQAAEEFVECGGALFKPLAGGGYSKVPYCPVCHSAMRSLEDLIAYKCGDPSCGMQGWFQWRAA